VQESDRTSHDGVSVCVRAVLSAFFGHLLRREEGATAPQQEECESADANANWYSTIHTRVPKYSALLSLSSGLKPEFRGRSAGV
jgi:hypothetical protein